MLSIAGYSSATSYLPEEKVHFHLNTSLNSTPLTIQIFRLGASEVEVLKDSCIGHSVATPKNAYAMGCDWPSIYEFLIPTTWSSGVYKAVFTTPSEQNSSTEVLFIVKEGNKADSARILFQLAVNTYQAYNAWGGKSLYDYNSTEKQRSHQISFDRPDRYEDFYTWEYPFIQWMEQEGFTAAYCTNVDLHADPTLLNPCQLLLSVGHDEYWSWEMRDAVEAFVARGGNVAFFGGNLCWWQVRFEADARQIVCYKDAALDPIRPIQPERTTINWKDTPVDRPENAMTGVSYADGAGWFNEAAGVRPQAGYQVQLQNHWVFENTHLVDGDIFGAEVPIIGYETDAARFTQRNTTLQVTGERDTPLNFVVLATADLRNWQPGGQAGWATMGMYQKGGFVFTAATVDWARGLVEPSPVVAQITRNILQTLSQARKPFPSIVNPGFTEWTEENHPDGWTVEGSGVVVPVDVLQHSNGGGLEMNAIAGQTWLTQGPFDGESTQLYRIAGWVKSARPDVSLRLQSMETWQDFAIATHSGSGQWEYLAAIAQPETEATLFSLRIKLEVSPGGIAQFGIISVERL